MKNSFAFWLKTDMHFGFGYCRNLSDFIKKRGFYNILFLIDEGVMKSDYCNEVLGNIKSEDLNTEVIGLRGSQEPDYDYLDSVVVKVRALKELDLIIGIGGGSTLDITKAVAALVTNPGKGMEYRGFDHVKMSGIPTALIPTTAGTGSEVTINAVFTDKKEMKKLGINGRYIHATYAILDGEWTLSCPQSVAVSSGMDALVHGLESYMNKNANILTRMLSSEAVYILCTNLPAVIEEPDNKERRQNLLLGSYLAGAALFNSGPGIAGALSYPIGVHYNAPHGMAGGVFVPSVVEYNIDRGYYEYDRLLDLIQPGHKMNAQEKSILFHKFLCELLEKLKVPKTLSEWGITDDDVEDISKLMIPMQPAFDQNPVPFSVQKDVLDMLKKHVNSSRVSAK
ncbi:iron-containing alcohol dehydrogenase family protein [Candidatus Omnitrophota bacterium]